MSRITELSGGLRTPGTVLLLLPVHLANRAEPGAEGLREPEAARGASHFSPGLLSRLPLPGGRVGAGSGCNLFLGHLRAWVPGPRRSLSFVSLQLLSLCPLSGWGPGPAPSRPGKWKPGGGKGESWVQSNTSLHTTPPPAAPWPLGRKPGGADSRPSAARAPPPPSGLQRRACGVWLRYPVCLVFSFPVLHPVHSSEGHAQLRGLALTEASGSQPSAPGSGVQRG